MQISAAKKAGWTIVLTAIAAFGLLSGSVLIFPLLVLPLTFIYCCVRYGWLYGLLSAAAVFALPLISGDVALCGALAAVYLPSVIAIGIAIRKGLRSFNALMLSVASFAAGLALLIAGMRLIGNIGLSDYIGNIVGDFAKEQPEAAHQLLVLLNAQSIIAGQTDISALLALPDAETVEVLTTTVTDYLYAVLPQMAVYFCFGGGMATFLIARAWLKRRGVQVCSLPAFAKWRLDKNAAWGMIFALLASFLYVFFPDSANVATACSVLLCAVVFVAQVAGLSFVEFLLSRTAIKSRGVKNLILIGVAAVLSLALTFAGLIDQAFRIKERLPEQRPPQKFY